jgi:hypothetical protein
VDGNNPIDGQVGVTTLSGDTSGVFVQGRNSAGTSDQEIPFTLIVNCP